MARILIVEDDKLSRRICVQLLKRDGYEVFEAENGRVAMEHLLRQPVDLVVTDMIMPVMDGVETILAVRRLYPNVKIIAMGASGLGPSESCLKIARVLGSHKTLIKPLITEEFLHAVQALIGKRKKVDDSGTGS
jgi:CheY-like chemotaxis protein